MDYNFSILGKMKLLISCVLHILVHRACSLDSRICSWRPHVYHLAGAVGCYTLDERSVSVPPSKLETSVVFNVRQFNCTYHEPVSWVFDVTPQDLDLIQTDVEFFQRETLENGEIQYSANFRLIYQLKFLKQPRLFSCEPSRITRGCQRTFIQGYRGSFHDRTRPVGEEEIVPVLKDVSGQLLNATFLKELHLRIDRSPEDCDDLPSLVVKVEDGNRILYKWQKEGDAPLRGKTVLTSNLLVYENLFRIKSMNQNIDCYRVLNASENCTNCKELNTTNIIGVIFHIDHETQFASHKGFFSVPRGDSKDRQFYFSSEITEEIISDEMLQFEVEDGANLYSNKSFKVTCRLSTFVFAVGATITKSQESRSDLDQDVNSNSSQTSPMETSHREKFHPDGYRSLEAEFIVKEENVTEYITCSGPLIQRNGWIRKTIPVVVQASSPPTIDGQLEDIHDHQTISPGTSTTLDCQVGGNPKPTYRWTLPSQVDVGIPSRINITDSSSGTLLNIPRWSDEFEGTYICQAQNHFGVRRKVVTLRSITSSPELSTIVSASLGGIMVLLGIIIYLLRWGLRRQRIFFRMQIEAAIEEFKNGTKQPQENLRPGQEVMPVLELPYDDSFEVARDFWKLDDKLLGTGQFGIVRIGWVQLNVGEERTKVAVKTLKSSAEIDQFKGFLFELKIMAYLGRHKNVVSLVAACTEQIYTNSESILIGVEFCEHGSLLDHLRTHRGTFLNMVTDDGNLLPDFHYVERLSSVEISSYDLVQWGHQVACGMDYLRVKKVLHGDLAARNVLLGVGKVAKVGDFGLSRVLSSATANYTKQSRTALPWKWMSIEALKYSVFSTQSDVWSYGVTLYEIFALGQTPYPGMRWCPEFVPQLEAGLRLQRPANCPMPVYEVMQRCWEMNPHERISFPEITVKLSEERNKLKAAFGSEKVLRKTESSFQTTVGGEDHFTPNSVYANTFEQYENMEYSNVFPHVSAPKIRVTMNYYKNC